LFVSPDTLIGTLDMIVIRDVRAMVVPDANRPMIQPAQPEKSHPSEIKMEKLQSDGAEHDLSVSIGALQHAQSPAALRIDPSGREPHAGGYLREGARATLPTDLMAAY
jgi:hypothetical protein